MKSIENCLRVEKKDNVCTISLIGELDAQNAGDLQHRIEDLLASLEGSPAVFLIFDAKELSYISSAGLRILIWVRKQWGKNMSVINISANLMEIFQIAGFQNVMDLKGI